MNDNSDSRQKLPDEVSGFKSGSFPKPPNQDDLTKLNLEILKTELDDYRWRIDNRGWVGKTIIGLLLGQNIAIFALIFIAYLGSDLCKIQTIVSVLVGGVLVETYFTLNYVVRWLFDNINYKLHKAE